MAPDRASNVSVPLTVSTTQSASTNHAPSSPTNPNLTRTRLKEIARWIRDDLDVQVAREGPHVLQPDDVLNLHEIFRALQHSRNISGSDLRATGIHRAVQDIAGVATRWPGGLCDDCDKIIEIWTAKFGPLSAIHPFLYGRGGRLEGIASVHEQSREALLKRWAKTCPQKIHPKRPHRLGDLGFVAGSWWINPLFAHHAGIIGLESCDGGTTYDKHGAYALLLKGAGELEVSSESHITYRLPQNDKGKFRLTDATPRSRGPVRILRSHSINSIWGPRAGVRYEGLYSVKGWSIKQAKSTDASGGRWKEGDILFDVKFERVDQTPMEVVINRPTATELDDYAEYKRLRKEHHNAKQRQAKATLNSQDSYPVLKVMPSIIPPPTPLASPNSLLLELPPSEIRKDMVKRLHFDEEAHVRLIEDDEALSPKAAPMDDPLNFVVGDKMDTLGVPSQNNLANTRAIDNPLSNGTIGRSSPVGSNGNSTRTAKSNPRVDIREVAPWIDYDADLTIPSPPEEPFVIHRRPIIAQTVNTMSSIQSQDTRSLRSKHREPLRSPVESTVSLNPTGRHPEDRHQKKNSDSKGMLGDIFSPQPTSKRDNKKSVAIRGRKIMSKLFDGVLEDEGELDRPPSRMLRERATSWQDSLRHHHHAMRRSSSSNSSLKLARRNAICICSDNESDDGTSAAIAPDDNSAVIVTAVPYEDPFVETTALRRPRTRPFLMENLISRSSLATAVGSAISTFVGRSGSPLEDTGEDSLAETRLRKMVERI